MKYEPQLSENEFEPSILSNSSDVVNVTYSTMSTSYSINCISWNER